MEVSSGGVRAEASLWTELYGLHRSSACKGKHSLLLFIASLRLLVRGCSCLVMRAAQR